MGGSRWSDDDYVASVTASVASHGTSFTYDHDIRTGTVAPKVHNLLDPKGLKVRESRDSDAHPESNAIVVALDVTGSMGAVIRKIHEKLPTLMGLLLRKNYISDPQILFAAIGDATCDRSPTQVGQFESGVEMEGDLAKFHIEGGGGGQNTESYEILAYVGARKTSIDCFEKRGRRGYFFFIGDELPYPNVKKGEIDRLIGPELESDIPTPQIMKELQQKYNVFYILPAGATNGHNEGIKNKWKDLLGAEQVLTLEDPSGAAELIATQIGLCEGSTDVDSAAADLKDAGVSTSLIHMVTSSVSKGYAGGSITKVAAGSLSPSGDSSSVKRL